MIYQTKEEYLLNPKFCYCGKIISYETRLVNQYCSHSCSAKKTNPSRRKIKYCKVCGCETKERHATYCSKKCETVFRTRKTAEKLHAGLLNDNSARRMFRIISEKVCSICGLKEWNGNPIPLVVDHIDGNHKNNLPSNLRMVCCNCDAQLPTYKAKNKGNGRTQRRL